MRTRTHAVLHAFAALLPMACGLVACGLEGPASFREVDLEGARAWAENATLVEAVEPGTEPAPPSPILRWELGGAPPEIPDGPVLVVAASASLGYRSAAALARSGNPSVGLVIVDDAEDRRGLYGRALREVNSGREPVSRRETSGQDESIQGQATRHGTPDDSPSDAAALREASPRGPEPQGELSTATSRN